MDVYTYIANSNPYTAKKIIESFGYKVVDNTQMGQNLKHLVASEGEPALREVLDNHPDKDIILELFAEKPEPCDCQKAKSTGFANASGTEEQPTTAKSVENNFSIVFLASAIIIAISILKTK